MWNNLKVFKKNKTKSVYEWPCICKKKDLWWFFSPILNVCQRHFQSKFIILNTNKNTNLLSQTTNQNYRPLNHDIFIGYKNTQIQVFDKTLDLKYHRKGHLKDHEPICFFAAIEKRNILPFWSCFFIPHYQFECVKMEFH